MVVNKFSKARKSRAELALKELNKTIKSFERTIKSDPTVAQKMQIKRAKETLSNVAEKQKSAILSKQVADINKQVKSMKKTVERVKFVNKVQKKASNQKVIARKEKAKVSRILASEKNQYITQLLASTRGNTRDNIIHFIKKLTPKQFNQLAQSNSLPTPDKSGYFEAEEFDKVVGWLIDNAPDLLETHEL